MHPLIHPALVKVVHAECVARHRSTQPRRVHPRRLRRRAPSVGVVR